MSDTILSTIGQVFCGVTFVALWFFSLRDARRDG